MKHCKICVYFNDNILLSFSSYQRLNISLQQMFDVSWAFKDINIKASKVSKDKPFLISFFMIFWREKPRSHAVVLIGIVIHSCHNCIILGNNCHQDCDLQQISHASCIYLPLAILTSIPTKSSSSLKHLFMSTICLSILNFPISLCNHSFVFFSLSFSLMGYEDGLNNLTTLKNVTSRKRLFKASITCWTKAFQMLMHLSKLPFFHITMKCIQVDIIIFIHTIRTTH